MYISAAPAFLAASLATAPAKARTTPALARSLAFVAHWNQQALPVPEIRIVVSDVLLTETDSFGISYVDVNAT